MQIVPSGNRKLTKLSQNSTIDSNLVNRDIVEQQSISSNDYNPIGNLEQKLKNNKPNNLDFKQPISFDTKQSKSDDKIENDFRSAYYSIMENLGVPSRIYKNPQHSDKLFQIEEEVIGQNDAKGFFVLPSKTQTKTVSKEEAWKIAKDLGSKFGVTKMNFKYVGENNYRFDFQIAVKEDNGSGTSLDSLVGKNGTSKTAESKNSIIKESKADIAEFLSSLGFGEKNAS